MNWKCWLIRRNQLFSSCCDTVTIKQYPTVQTSVEIGLLFCFIRSENTKGNFLFDFKGVHMGTTFESFGILRLIILNLPLQWVFIDPTISVYDVTTSELMLAPCIHSVLFSSCRGSLLSQTNLLRGEGSSVWLASIWTWTGSKSGSSRALWKRRWYVMHPY